MRDLEIISLIFNLICILMQADLMLAGYWLGVSFVLAGYCLGVGSLFGRYWLRLARCSLSIG